MQVGDNILESVNDEHEALFSLGIGSGGNIVTAASSTMSESFGASAVVGRDVFDLFGQYIIDGFRHEALRVLRSVLTRKIDSGRFFAGVSLPETIETRYLLFEIARINGAALAVSAERGAAEQRPFISIVARESGVSEFFCNKLNEARNQYERLVAYGNLLIVRTDHELIVTDAFGDTERVLGVPNQELLNDRHIWSKLLHSDDWRELAKKLKQPSSLKELHQEIRVLNKRTGDLHWLLLKAIPIYSSNQEFYGWEGFGLDITEEHATREELISQRRRIEALYEVSRSLLVNMDPAFVALKGLRALLKATGSDCGLGCFYDQDTEVIEIVAAEGLSSQYLQKLSKYIGERSLVKSAIEEKRGFLINNIQQDPQARSDIARMEGLRSTIVMPLLFEGEVLGALVLFCKKANRYTEADFDLVAAGSSQIGLAARQAESYAADKRHAHSLAALYQLSHELARRFTPKDIAEHAFAVIQREISCKRMWLGVINEQGTQLVGQAGFGPGIRRHIAQLKVGLDSRHEFLDQALKNQTPVVVRPGQVGECSNLNRILKRLGMATYIIIPLVALGRVVGVLIVEPIMSSTFFAQRKLPLLTSMAAEIGAVILARRFEARMADADKMRMAGLLAAGVAHNFNNMLQAVMGQASLIEMQLAQDSPLSNSARMIIDAAGRGASLIKQLLSFSMQSAPSRRSMSVNKLLLDSAELYKSVLGSGISLETSLEEGTPDILADYSQIQQVITNILVNAKEAIGDRENGYVRVVTRSVRLRSGEVDPELAPGLYLRIDIEDNGAGMDPEKQARCFEPFFTTKNVDSRTGISFSASGLGLSSAYSILKQHDGIVTVSSHVGEGTTFSLFIPVVNQVKPTLAAPSAKSLAPKSLVHKIEVDMEKKVDGHASNVAVAEDKGEDSKYTWEPE